MQVHNLEADVEGGKGCELINVTVRSINGSKYISIGQDSKVVCIEDIEETTDDITIEDSGHAKVRKREIIAVTGIDT